jgi:GGDEF domain-containing protein
VGLFAKRPGRPVPGAEPSAELRAALPPRFEAVGETLAAAGPHVLETCQAAGRELADLGASLGEGLDGLRATTRLVARRDPTFEECHALALAWSEATLAYLHGLSCADPLTGLATLAHLRERLSELYRDAAARSHALVVTQADLRGPAGGLDPLSAARRLTLLGETARSVFVRASTVGRAGHHRVVVLAPRDQALASRVSLLTRMVAGAADRVWVERLPGTDESAALRLDELARGS